MVYAKNSHCSYCGAAFEPGLPWPRTCTRCQNISFLNPIPVAVVILPIHQPGQPTGLLVIRRSIPPKIGELALPGGYVNLGETWQEAGAREVLEETGLQIVPDEIRELRVRSAPDGSLIIFGMAQVRPAAVLPPFIPNEEASERLILTQPAPLAFGLHQTMVELFFQNPDRL